MKVYVPSMRPEAGRLSSRGRRDETFDLEDREVSGIRSSGAEKVLCRVTNVADRDAIRNRPAPNSVSAAGSVLESLPYLSDSERLTSAVAKPSNRHNRRAPKRFVARTLPSEYLRPPGGRAGAECPTRSDGNTGRVDVAAEQRTETP